MSDEQAVDPRRRRFLTLATTGMSVAGGVFAATPFVLSMLPSDRAKAAGAPVEVDLSKLEPGQMLRVKWRGKPVWIVYRTPEMLASIPALDEVVVDPDSAESIQPEYAANKNRSIKPEILVLVGICTHLGCSPVKNFQIGPASGRGYDWLGGFFCNCHGSKFDLAGRVYKNVPAPTNLVVPPHSFTEGNRVVIGIDPSKEVA